MTSENYAQTMESSIGIGAFVWSPGLRPYAFRFSVESYDKVSERVADWIDTRAVDRYLVTASDGIKAIFINWASLAVVEVMNRDPDADLLADYVVIEVFVDETTGRIGWAV